MKNSETFSIDWKKALALIESGKLKPIGSNLSQINNQGEYYISKDETKLYKRRHTAGKSINDLIAES
jgi:hypothetical protein